MKTSKLSLFSLLVLAAFFLISGCAKQATKEQALEQRAKLMAWYESEDFKKLICSYLNDDGTIKDQAKFEKDLKEAENKMIDQIVQKMGFKSQEVKEADKKLEETALAAITKIITDFATKRTIEEMKKSESMGN
jgi:hypothetical protein